LVLQYDGSQYEKTHVCVKCKPPITSLKKWRHFWTKWIFAN